MTVVPDITNQWCFNTDSGRTDQWSCISRPFKNVFDRDDIVDHELLLTKLEYIGVRGRPLLEWFKSYHVVYINGVLSEKSILKCGVPKASTLWPLLFLIDINDFSNIMDYAAT